MANIETRTNKDGTTSYRVKIRMKGYPVQSATFNRKTDAREWARQTEAAMKEGRYFKTAEAKKHSVKEMIDRYLEYVKQRNPKRRKDVEHYLKWWGDQIGVYSLADVNKALIVEQRDKLIDSPGRNTEQRTHATVNRYMTAFGHALSVAMNEWEWIHDHPMRKIPKLTEPRGRVRFLDDDERQRLLTACKSSKSRYLYAVVVLALSTGARQGEIMNLRWPDVDLQRGMIVLHDTKNKERRTLALKGHALDVMREHEKVRRINTDLVFPAANGKKVMNIRASWLYALEQAKIEDFRFHDLRHSAASYLAMNGATLAEIAEILGHKTLAMVKRYAHLSESHTHSVVASMNEKIFGNG